MAVNKKLIESIDIPTNLCPKFISSPIPFYEKIEIYVNRVSGSINGQVARNWYYQNFIDIEIINSSSGMQLAQVVFLTGVNLKTTDSRIDLSGSRDFNNVFKDPNRIVLQGDPVAVNQFINSIGSKIRTAFEKYKKHEDDDIPYGVISPADELKKFKELLDARVISQKEFEAKKKQLLAM